jgi:hypothetical protein
MLLNFIRNSGLPYYEPGMIHPRRSQNLRAITYQLNLRSTRLRAAKGDRFLFRADIECGLTISGTLPDRAQFIDSRFSTSTCAIFQNPGKRQQKKTQTKS